MHPDLQFTGLLSPLDSPHHVRQEERSKYREGVVMDRKGVKGSLVNCGIKNRPVEIDRVLMAGIRVTVQLDVKVYGSAGKIYGTVVSPSAPREDDGTYWGYTTRLASSINAVFEECPFEGGYDLKIGTSERGDVTVDDSDFAIPKFHHSLIVFGGVAGIEECVDADESLKIPGSQSRKLFDMWVNTCPYQGSRTIRTEEAVLITLCRLSPYLASKSETQSVTLHTVTKETEAITFSDEEPSEESSGDEE
jgi:predicted SPOUT superfamily RNA methylase MTH1